nr:unnamed protein product [Callosobruchus analis]
MTTRNKKTAKPQMEVIVQFLEENKIIIHGKCHPMQTSQIEEKWRELSEKLNEVPNGARKEIKDWKSFFYQWKSKIKKRAREQRQHISQTGGGGYICSELSETENRLMGLIGWEHVVGCRDVEEPGLPGSEMEAPQEVIIEQTVVENPELEIFEQEPLIEKAEIMPNSETPSRPTISVRKTASRKKLVRPQRAQTQLQEAADLYASSTSEMATAVGDMAVAITNWLKAYHRSP